MFARAYLEALGAMRALGKPTVLALTATAPPEVIDDITEQLNLGQLHIEHGRASPQFVVPRASRHQRHRQARQLVEPVREMSGSDRAPAQDAFMNGGVPLIVATNAFGMGDRQTGHQSRQATSAPVSY